MKQIEPLHQMTRWEKISLKLKKMLLIKVVAYSAGAAVGTISGTLVQQQERSVTGYEPASHAQLKDEMSGNRELVDDFEKYKKEKKKSTLERFKIFSERMKESFLNPKKAIENTDTYKQVKLQFLDSVKYVDDVAFLLPAILTFILLGGYLDRKLSSIQGDVVQKKEMELVRNKINEIIVQFEYFKNKIEKNGVESLTEEEIVMVKSILREVRESLPEDGDLGI